MSASLLDSVKRCYEHGRVSDLVGSAENLNSTQGPFWLREGGGHAMLGSPVPQPGSSCQRRPQSQVGLLRRLLLHARHDAL